MRNHMITVAVLALLSVTPAAFGQDTDERRWPREFKGEGGSLVIHQPQVESWKDHKTIDCRAAVEIRIAQATKPSYGVVRCEMSTVVSHDNRTVTLLDPKLTGVAFPELSPTAAKASESVLRRLFPSKSASISLDRVLTNMEREPGTQRNVEYRHDPPKIILSHVDAVLVHIDGEPMFEKVGDTDLEVVINTQSNLFRSGAALYLLVDKGWLTAPELGGQWARVTSLPSAFRGLPAGARFDEVKKHVPGKPFEKDAVPMVYTASEPTELVVFYGEPALKEIPGTRLRYAVNTESDCFQLEGEGNYYILLSGRWFRTTGRAGPFTYCTRDLPDDFRKIPDRHPAGRVLASVPGTDQADEAVLAAQIPRRARVTRSGTTVDVSFEGEPEFKPIAGADGVEAAINTSYHVYRVAGHYYCCHQGVWFDSAALSGPWAVCDKVPQAIYAIPPESPYYPDTFVFVYGSDDDSVDTGYWPGYYGCYPYDDCVCYGTGYSYRYWGRRFYRNWYHHYRPRPWPYRTYGAARYYDHRAGRFRRTACARRHRVQRAPHREVYTGWGDNVRPTEMTRKLSAGRERMSGTRRVGGQDLYAGRDGSVYRRRENGQWESYKKSGWQARERAEKRERGKEKAAERKAASREKREKVARERKAREEKARERRALDRAHRARQRQHRASQHRTYGGSRIGRAHGGGRITGGRGRR